MICTPCSLKLWEGFLCAFLTWDGATTNDLPWRNTEKSPWNRAQNLTEIGSTSKSLPKSSCFISAIYSILNTVSTNLKVILAGKNAWNSYGTWWKWCFHFSSTILEAPIWNPFFNGDKQDCWIFLGTVLSSFNIFRKPILLKRKLEALQPF